jgi:16S rRNA (cytidine1402-2'-O)-methyltransferase
LYIVPTPIGNLEDITLRALTVLREVDLILAEDTRNSGKLLKHFNISTRMVSHHMHNEHKTVDFLSERLLSGENIALISDAGTPGISDPGFLLVNACIEKNVEVYCLPGPTALIPALVNSGLPSDRFCFEGFLPEKKGRQTRLQQLAQEQRTMLFYVSPHKLLKTLLDFIVFFGADRQVCVSRELSKLHEENVRGTLEEVHQYFSKKTIKGEIVVTLSGIQKKSLS